MYDPPCLPRLQSGEVRLQLRCQTVQWNEQQPMYPARLCRCVSQLRRPSTALLYNCHVHTRCTVSVYNTVHTRCTVSVISFSHVLWVMWFC